MGNANEARKCVNVPEQAEKSYKIILLGETR